jgi:uncharacterized CHY-type Zn-finger protein
MSDSIQNVKPVRCGHCEKYFGYSLEEEQTKCPFCQTVYGEAEEVAESKTEEEKKVVAKGKKPKESFKMWG